MNAYNFRARGSSLTKLCHVTCRYLSIMTWIQIFAS